MHLKMRLLNISILVCVYQMLAISSVFSFTSFLNADPSELYEEGDRICQDLVETQEDVEYDTTIYCYPDHNNTLRICPDAKPVKACHTMYEKKCDITFRPRMKKVRVRICPGEKNDVVKLEESGGYRNNVVIDVRSGGNLASKKSPCVGGRRKICVTKYETECSTVRRMKKMIEDHPRCKIEHLRKCNEDNQCSKVPSMKCRIEKRQVTKVKPETSCRRVPRDFCRKVNCAKEAEKSCYYRLQMVNEILPEETCNYRPQRVCHELDHKSESKESADFQNRFNATRPGTVDEDGCTISPAQKCERRQSNPRKVQKKMKKKVCSTKAELEKQKILHQLFKKRP